MIEGAHRVSIAVFYELYVLMKVDFREIMLFSDGDCSLGMH